MENTFFSYQSLSSNSFELLLLFPLKGDFKVGTILKMHEREKKNLQEDTALNMPKKETESWIETGKKEISSYPLLTDQKTLPSLLMLCEEKQFT